MLDAKVASVVRSAVLFVFVLLLFTFPARQADARTVSLASSMPGPAPLGDVVTWTADATGDTSSLWYRFRVRYLGTVPAACAAAVRVPVHGRCVSRDFVMVRDYGPGNSLDWTATELEGDYEIEVSTRDNDSGEVNTASSIFHVMPRVTGTDPVLSETAARLVFRYSAPPCPAGSRMRVQFQAGDGAMQRTPPKLCDGVTTMNFYLAGMRAETSYTIQHIVSRGSRSVSGPVLTQTTPPLDQSFGPYTVTKAPDGLATEPILLHSRGGWPVATDLAGNVVWYYPEAISFLARPEPGGYFLGWYEDQAVDPSRQILREFDLAGMTIRETNAARVSEQLVEMGMHAINSFHHEARALPDGKILALAASERILTDVQGPGAVDVLGDTILVLDANLQVLWAWDTFDHLDTRRRATLNETCNQAANGCAPIYLAAVANDWTHSNSVQLTPDGNLLLSSRHQDWLIKIDYRNGGGTGEILWRLGKDGDFQFLSDDPYPWFSHQHDAAIGADGMLTLFDNGNVRHANDASAHSRGQVIRLDEENRTATLVLNADLGAFSIALGSAQKLDNGDYHFHMGFLPASNTARAVEVDPSGTIVYQMDIGELEYRSFRRSDLYLQ
jgi:arylsulfate sulfotransferase